MSSPLVQIRKGTLRGSIQENEDDGNPYFSFRGIPYARPPLGQLRFQDPQPLDPWNGIRDAVTESSKPVQFDEYSYELIGSEDCLYLNLATNSLSGKRPVMVWIHGGGFMSGSGSKDLYSPDYLLKHDIVLVSINYRLGIFGFLNMETNDCSGNQGLKDQVCALKWVQENIEFFGGDKSNVTIFGQSAGGASVHYHCLSTQSQGLFHKAIIQSGTVANFWSYRSSNKDKTFEIAATLGKKTSNSEEAVNFLRTISAKEILQVQERLFPHDLLMEDFIFIPTIDSKSNDPFLTNSPSELLKNKINYPLMIGFNSHESIIPRNNDKDWQQPGKKFPREDKNLSPTLGNASTTTLALPWLMKQSQALGNAWLNSGTRIISSRTSVIFL